MKKSRGVSRTTAKSKFEIFVIKRKAVNFCHKELHLRFCGSPRYVFGRSITNNSSLLFKNIY